MTRDEAILAVIQTKVLQTRALNAWHKAYAHELPTEPDLWRALQKADREAGKAEDQLREAR